MVLVFLEKEDSMAVLRNVGGQEAAAHGNWF